MCACLCVCVCVCFVRVFSNVYVLCVYVLRTCLSCVCVSVCGYARACVCGCVLHYYRGPQPEYTPSTEDRTDVRGRLGRQFFFLCLKSPPKRGRTCKIGFRGMSSDDGLRRVWTCVFFLHTIT